MEKKKVKIRHFKIDREIAKHDWDKYVKMGTVEPLIERLMYGDSGVRRSAAWALGEIGDVRAVDALIKALKDEDSDVRERVAWALGEIGWKPGNDEERVLYYIAKRNWGGCVKMGSFAVEFLIERLKDKNSDVRENVAWALGVIGDARAVDSLIEALKDLDSDVRENVAWALGKIGWKPGNDEERVLYYIAKRDWGGCVKMGSFAVEFLIKRLKDKNSDVRRSVAWALGVIGDARAVSALIKALKDENSVIRIRVAEALGKIGDARAVDALIDALRDWNRDVRESVAWALGEIGDARAVEALIEALKDEVSDVRENSIDALVKIAKKDLGVVDKLIKALKDKDSDVRRSVAWALDGIGWKSGNDEEKVLYYIAKRDWGRCVEMDGTAVEFLIERLKDKNSYVRENVAWALGAIGDARAVNALINLLKDKNKDVCESARKALVNILKILGVDFEYDYEKWKRWWKENEGKFLK